jgi:hypothetical protein
MLKGTVSLALCLLITLTPLWAGDADAADPQEEGVGLSTTLNLQISSLPEAKLGLTQNFIFPVFRGSNPLTADNNLNLGLTAEVTPVSMDGILEAVLTPIAFLQIAAGSRAATGWNMFLGDGIGINTPLGEKTGENPRKYEVKGDPFSGLIWDLYGGGAFQFDMAAVIPGDWNHILFRTYHEARYRRFTGAQGRSAWVFENDDAENQNGWIYYANFVLGYQMPRSPVLNTVAFMAEVTKNLYKTPGGGDWGDSLGAWIFSALFNLQFTEKFSSALVLQMRTRRNYGISDLNNKDHYYYQDMVLQKNDGKRRLVFYRAALLMSYKLK